MRALVLYAGGLIANAQQQPVMQRREIRHAENKVAANLQRAAYLVEDPEDVLQMLEDLVGHDQVERLIGEGQPLAFDVDAGHVDALCGEGPHVRRIRLDRMQRSAGRGRFRQRQVGARTCANIQHRRERRNRRRKVPHHISTVVQLPIDHRKSPRSHRTNSNGVPF